MNTSSSTNMMRVAVLGELAKAIRIQLHVEALMNRFLAYILYLKFWIELIH